MSTNSLPKGRAITILDKDESAYATLPSGNWNQTIAYGPITLGEKQGFEDDPILGLNLLNDVDASLPAPALPSAGGNFVVPLDLSHMGNWLRRAFGAPVTTGSDPDYTHVFSSGAEVLPTFGVEIKKGTSLFYVTLGIGANQLIFNASRKAGYDRFTVATLASKESKFTTTQGGTPVAMVARDPVPASLPLFKFAGSTAGQVLGLDLTYDNKLTGEDFLSGDAHISGIERDVEATCTGSLKVRYKDATYHDHAISGDANTGELIWTKGAARSFSWLMNAMRIERTPIEIAGPGGIDVSFPFRCEATAGAAMIVATLKSAVAVF